MAAAKEFHRKELKSQENKKQTEEWIHTNNEEIEKEREEEEEERSNCHESLASNMQKANNRRRSVPQKPYTLLFLPLNKHRGKFSI